MVPDSLNRTYSELGYLQLNIMRQDFALHRSQSYKEAMSGVQTIQNLRRSFILR